MRVTVEVVEPRAGCLFAKDAIHPRKVGVIQREEFRWLGLQAHRVIGLLVLTPPDIADEALIIERDPLSPDGQSRSPDVGSVIEL